MVCPRGQGYSFPPASTIAAGLDVPELSYLSFEKTLGDARLIKTIRARHHQGLVVVKVAAKPNTGLGFQKYIDEIMRR